MIYLVTSPLFVSVIFVFFFSTEFFLIFLSVLLLFFGSDKNYKIVKSFEIFFFLSVMTSLRIYSDTSHEIKFFRHQKFKSPCVEVDVVPDLGDTLFLSQRVLPALGPSGHRLWCGLCTSIMSAAFTN